VTLVSVGTLVLFLPLRTVVQAPGLPVELNYVEGARIWILEDCGACNSG
jgi:hypothetical protein